MYKYIFYVYAQECKCVAMSLDLDFG